MPDLCLRPTCAEEYGKRASELDEREELLTKREANIRQQYDRVRISGAKGEKYVASVEEAEMLGFRHAYRWRGDSATS